MTRIALTSLPNDDDGQTPRPRLDIGHCHLPRATPDCSTCVEVYGVEWAARERVERAAAAQLRAARAAARTAATARTRRGPAAAQSVDDDTAGSELGRTWDYDPAADRGWDDGWGDSA